MTKRNEPCPCGSGKKYKKCCYLTQSNSAKAFNQELKEVLQQQAFNSLDNVQGFVDNYINEHSNQSIAAFHGLTPDDMHQLLYQPFESPSVISFNSSNLPEISQVPIIFLALELAKAMEEGGLKPTAKGNLPQKLVRQIYQAYTQSIYKPKYELPINKEEDFYDLNVARHLMMLSGLMRKYGGEFVITKQMKRYLNDTQAGNKQAGSEQYLSELYFALFKTFCLEFNWAYSSYDESYGFVQQSFGFSLYLLGRFGDSFKHTDVYGDYFIDAFPDLLLEVEALYSSPEDNIKGCFSFWVFEKFTRYFGLAELQYTANERGYFCETEVKATPLLKSFVQFKKRTNVIKGNCSKH